MGWVRRTDEKDADYNWFLKGTHKDDNGQPSTYYPNFQGFAFQFMRKRSDGALVDGQGHKAPGGKQQNLSEVQMIKEAAVKPPTWYFENPEEEYAEGVKLYRTSAKSRAELQRTSPVLYGIMKENDQAELDQRYGVKNDGSHKVVRLANGVVSDTTKAN